jgi:hypothetical protein
MAKEETITEAFAWLVEHGILVWNGQIRNGERVYGIANEYRDMDESTLHALFNAADSGEN